MKKLGLLAIVLAITITLVYLIAPPIIERSKNKVSPQLSNKISNTTHKLHQSLFIGDWHSDSTLWHRNLLTRADYGHMDLPRLQAGNVALQMFTTTTKSPANQNYHTNSADGLDNITLLAIVQGWPIKSWFNLTERAIHQATRLKTTIANSNGEMRLITNQQHLTKFIEDRKSNQHLVGALLGTEGSHALEGKLDNIKRLYNEGFRMMSLQHFFDNKLGGSLHGKTKAGLTAFGKSVIKALNNQHIIIDVSHSSEQVVQDVLALSTTPIIVSHTGLHGFCPSARNISDKLIKEIAEKNGLIALGYWSAAACDTSPRKIAQQIAYGITLVGAEHIALGSDFDGAVTTGFDTSQLAIITDELLKLKISEHDIKRVMGENMKHFLLANLPQK